MQALSLLAGILIAFILGPTVLAFGWSAFLTPISGVAAPSFWHLLGLVLTLRMLLQRGTTTPEHKLIDEEADKKAHERRMKRDPSYATAAFEIVNAKLWKAIGSLLGLWLFLWLVS